MKEYFNRVFSNCKKWEIAYWWVFRALMIYAFIKGFLKVPFDISDPLQIAGNFIAMFAWEIFQALPKKTFVRQMPSFLQDVSIVMIFCASFGGKFMNFYYDLRWWDSAMHLASGALCVFLGYEVVVAMQKRDMKVAPACIATLCAFGFSFFVSTGWELFEFTADQVMCAKGLVGDAQHWCYELAEGTPKIATIFNPVFPERWSLMDTMDDIILNTIGAVVAWIVLKIYPYHHKGAHNINSKILTQLEKDESENTEEKVLTKV